MSFLNQTTVDELIASYGYIAIFGIILLESAGIPLPGETILLGAAIYAGYAGHTVDHCDGGSRGNSWRQYRLLARAQTWAQSVAQVGTLVRFGPAEGRCGRVSLPPTWRQNCLSRTLRRGTARICCRARRR